MAGSKALDNSQNLPRGAIRYVQGITNGEYKAADVGHVEVFSGNLDGGIVRPVWRNRSEIALRPRVIGRLFCRRTATTDHAPPPWLAPTPNMRSGLGPTTPRDDGIDAR